jgi:hypothetical protein
MWLSFISLVSGVSLSHGQVHLLIFVLEPRIFPTFLHLFFLVGQMAHFGVGGISCTISLALASCIHNAFKVPFEDRCFCYQAFFEHPKPNHQFPLCYQANFQTAHVIRMRRTHVLAAFFPKYNNQIILGDLL